MEEEEEEKEEEEGDCCGSRGPIGSTDTGLRCSPINSVVVLLLADDDDGDDDSAFTPQHWRQEIRSFTHDTRH